MLRAWPAAPNGEPSHTPHGYPRVGLRGPVGQHQSERPLAEAQATMPSRAGALLGHKIAKLPTQVGLCLVRGGFVELISLLVGENGQANTYGHWRENQNQNAATQGLNHASTRGI